LAIRGLFVPLVFINMAMLAALSAAAAATAVYFRNCAKSGDAGGMLGNPHAMWLVAYLGCIEELNSIKKNRAGILRE